VKSAIYKAADDAKYTAMSRTDSGRFMDGLVKEKNIGGVLENYIPKQQIRHYIKDGVLNRYNKDKARNAYDLNVGNVIKSVFGFSAVESGKGDGVILFRSQQHAPDGKYVVVATGTFLKWETALRKALCFIATAPFSENAESIQTLLVLYAQDKVIPPADKTLLENALKVCDAKVHIVGG
jgi:hypothetical protein